MSLFIVHQNRDIEYHVGRLPKRGEFVYSDTDNPFMSKRRYALQQSSRATICNLRINTRLPHRLLKQAFDVWEIKNPVYFTLGDLASSVRTTGFSQ